MTEKKFPSKLEDVPVITGFVLESFEKDKADFLAYSPVFADPFSQNMHTKQGLCSGLINSVEMLQLQKMVKQQLDDTLSAVRISLNKLEGYLKICRDSLDILPEDFRLKYIRAAINDQNIEKALLELHSLANNLKRNENALRAVGFDWNQSNGLIGMTALIEEQNMRHNTKKNERGRVSENNLVILNDLWSNTMLIIDAANAIYKGVDKQKLKEYTLTNLLKRVHKSSPAGSGQSTPATDKPV